MFKKKQKYYSLNKILELKAQYNIIIGERSNGKTFSCLEYAIKQYLESGKQSAYIRRWKEDIVSKRSGTLFDNFVYSPKLSDMTNGKYTTIIFSRAKWYLGNIDESSGKAITDEKPFMYAFALSDTEHDKSTSYPDVTTIIFDEFISRNQYLPDEFIIFMNCLSTIIRDRNNVKIFMLGNTINKFAPYFQEMGLKHITQMKKGKIDLYSYGESKLKVAVELCQTNETESKKSDVYFAFDNPKLKMITKGEWELDIYPHLALDQKIDFRKDVLFKYYILFDGVQYEMDIINSESGLFTFAHYCTCEINYKKELIFTMDYNTSYNIRKSIFRAYDKIGKKILNFFYMNKVFYQNNEIGEGIHNYLLSVNDNSIKSVR